jgi:hypothetical protein
MEAVEESASPSTLTTSQMTASAVITNTTTLAKTSAIKATEKTSIFEEYGWLDNVVQLICERLLRLVKLLIQKFVMKQNLSIADFLMNILIA